ncbi:hypothetical protein BpHYR1_013949 [Brachionus plicatilis]|uniref:Uncharacterized protein n=1 Tax=Brachionus plicatilis TaxID=10195 RepID=A0A3M7R3E2_BRAPC|nr:hypothetical protein BpHYR1_013949 [Brachionus plicatilis]
MLKSININLFYNLFDFRSKKFNLVKQNHNLPFLWVRDTFFSPIFCQIKDFLRPSEELESVKKGSNSCKNFWITRISKLLHRRKFFHYK